MSDYAGIARRLKLPHHDDHVKDPRELVLNWLNEQDSEWLMILDNVDDAGLIFPSKNAGPSSRQNKTTKTPLINYLPSRLSSRQSLLITTRRRNLGEDLSNGERGIEVPPFDTREAHHLLRSRSKGWTDINDSSKLTELLKILEYVPLAISQAAAFIKRNQISLQRYLASLEKDDQNLTEYLSDELQDARRERGFPNAVFRTWKLSFNQIRDQEPHAAYLLSLMAMLDRREIPVSLLKHPDHREIDCTNAIGTLKTFALIVQEADSEAFTMHRLVQLSLHDWLEQAGKKVWFAEQALHLLVSPFPSSRHDNKEACSCLYSQAQAVLRYDLKSKSSMKARILPLFRLGRYDQLQENFNDAEAKFSEANTMAEKVFGKNSLEELNYRGSLAVALADQGKYRDAEAMHRQILKLRETALGEKHRDTMMSMHNLAATLGIQGKCIEAEAIYRQTLKLKETELGEKHPDTLRCMNNLARTLSAQGKYEEAEAMHRHTLKLRKTTLMEKHPETLSSKNDLARTLSDQGKYEEAKALYQQTLKLRNLELGEKHSDTLATVWGLAHLYHAQQGYDEADTWYRRAVTGFQETLGRDHPMTARCQNELSTLREMEKSRTRNHNDK